MPGYDFSQVRCLIVDDSATMRKLVRAMLNSLGTGQIREAADGEKAIEMLRQWPIDLVLADVSMAPMDGLDFVRHLRRSDRDDTRHVPVVMLTGHGDVETICLARDAGANEILAKPITARTLAHRISEVVERPRPFIRAASYIGPDRRRRRLASQHRRRATDSVATPRHEESWQLDIG